MLGDSGAKAGLRLLVHVGSEKTGSSALQTRIVRARDVLSESGVFVPKTINRHEQRMLRGLVSAGNAWPSICLLSAERVGELAILLKDWSQEAVIRNSHTVLLTSEMFLAAGGRDWVSSFCSVAGKAGYTDTKFLLFLREPVSQCLSLYKHRAKRGTAGGIADWVIDGYRLPKELHNFRAQTEQLGITPTVRGYTCEPGGLEKRFFEDWLGVPTPSVDMPASVNPSLTLSELILIKQMAERRPSLVEPLYEALLAIDTADKVQGTALEAHAKAVATAAVAKHADEWQAWNRLLPPDEALPIPDPPADIPPRPRELGFSDRQMAALAAVIDEASSVRFSSTLLWREQLRPLLARVKASVLRNR